MKKAREKQINVGRKIHITNLQQQDKSLH